MDLAERLAKLPPPHWKYEDFSIYDSISDMYGIECRHCNAVSWITRASWNIQTVHDKKEVLCDICHRKLLKRCQISIDRNGKVCNEPAVYKTYCENFYVCEQHKYNCRYSERRNHTACYSTCMMKDRPKIFQYDPEEELYKHVRKGGTIENFKPNICDRNNCEVCRNDYFKKILKDK